MVMLWLLTLLVMVVLSLLVCVMMMLLNIIKLNSHRISLVVVEVIQEVI
jgi:hypothetical protein